MAAELGLVGTHQIENAAVACAIADALADAGYPITRNSVEVGLTGARLPGRWEIVSDSPSIILDGAHNPDKAAALAAALKAHKDRRRLALVVGVLGYKAADEIVNELASVADFVVATEPAVYMKAPLPASDVGRIARSTGVEVAVRSDPFDALDAATRWSGPDGLVCVTGSLYLVGQVRERWYPSSAINLQGTPYPTFDDAT
jgi:dihydrofolate synthase/folylpolyglutamate synthase